MDGGPTIANGSAWVPQGSYGGVDGWHQAQQMGPSCWWEQQGSRWMEVHSEHHGGVVGLLGQSFTLTPSIMTAALSSEALGVIGATFFHASRPRHGCELPPQGPWGWAQTASKIIHFKIL